MDNINFEAQLFQMYGEPSDEDKGDELVERLLNEVMRRDRRRTSRLLGALGIGALLVVVALTALLRPLLSAASAVGQPTPVGALWIVAALFLGWGLVQAACEDRTAL